MRKFYLLLFTFVFQQAFSQSTYDRVYTILQTNCVSSCHNTANHYGNLDLSGTQQDVYNALYKVTPYNTAAAAMGNKLVDPGDALNSFLFKKIQHGMEVNLTLTAGENPTTHDTLPALTLVEREMVRQWVLFGAKDTGTFVSEQTISTFYVNQGGQPRIQPLAPPAPGTGVQLHWGPVFMESGSEWEYQNKHHVRNSGPIDVNRMNTVMNDESHHYALFKFWPGHDTMPMFSGGMHKVNSIGDEAILFYNTDVVAQWPNNIDLTYPLGTGLVWEDKTVMSLSYHLINYNDSVIAAETYTNIYYAPHNAATVPILTAQIRYGGDQVGDLVIPNTGQDTTFVINQYDADSAFLWNVISMQAHTHKLGKDFNVWTRTLAGAKDSLIYDGSYDASYTYDQGVYIWNDPPYRSFTPALPVDMRKGFIHEATFNNSGPDTVGFGLTSSDEMYVTFIVYYKSDYTSVNNVFADGTLKCYPNPAAGQVQIELGDNTRLENASMKIYDLMGNLVSELGNISERRFSMNVQSLQNGCYLYRLYNNGAVAGSGKIMVQQ